MTLWSVPSDTAPITKNIPKNNGNKITPKSHISVASSQTA